MTTLDLDTRQALLAAVLADPDADEPRQHFADWCDDHGEPERGEFVRVQLELATFKPRHVRGGHEGTGSDFPSFEVCSCGHCTLRRREWALWEANQAEWQGQLLAAVVGGAPADVSREVFLGQHQDLLLATFRAPFVRGFPEVFTMSAALWLRHRSALVAAAPVRRLVVSDWQETPTVIEGNPLRLWYAVNADIMLPEAVRPGCVWELDIRDGRLYDGRVEVVAAGQQAQTRPLRHVRIMSIEQRADLEDVHSLASYYRDGGRTVVYGTAESDAPLSPGDPVVGVTHEGTFSGLVVSTCDRQPDEWGIYRLTFHGSETVSLTSV